MGGSLRRSASRRLGILALWRMVLARRPPSHTHSRMPNGVLEHFVAVNESRFGFEQTTEHLGWVMKQEWMALQAVVPPSVD